MDDDLYPNDSSYFVPREPQDQINARKTEKAQIIQGLRVLKDIIKHLDDRIAFYESVSSIPDAVRTKPDEFLVMHNAHTLAARSLREEKEYIEQLIESTR